MGTYTMTLAEVIDIQNGTLTLGTDGITRMTGADIGLDHYAIWDEEYRPILNGKIIDHYLNREIGMENISMWRHAMRRKMNEIMPYYNQVYNTIALNNDPLRTMNIQNVSSGTTSQTSNVTDTNDTTSGTNSGARTVVSDTPQTMLSGNEDYATGATDSNSATTATGHGVNTNTADVNGDSSGTSTTSGFTGLASDLIMRYRESLLNIDLTIITILQECFMQVWDNGDSLTF